MGESSDVDYFTRLIEVAEAARELTNATTCLITDDKSGCDNCEWCRLADALDELREEHSS